MTTTNQSYAERATLIQIIYQTLMQHRSKSAATSPLQAVEAELMHDFCRAVPALAGGSYPARQVAWRNIAELAQQALELPDPAYPPQPTQHHPEVAVHDTV